MSGEEKSDQPAFWRGGRTNQGSLAGQDPVNPDHYKFPNGAEVIEITRHLGFLAGNVVKYVARADRKGGLTDLLKARQYLDWLIEDATAARSGDYKSGV